MKISVNTSDVVKFAAHLGGVRPRLEQSNKQIVYGVGNLMVRHIREMHRDAPPPDPTDSSTVRRTGTLLRSYAHTVEETGGGGLQLTVGVTHQSAKGKALQYAATHEFGATIRAKGDGWLAIPLPAAKTERGVPRGGPRDFENTFFIRSKSGDKLVLMQKIGTGVVPIFVMVKSVTIPARPGLEPARQEFQPELVRRLEQNAARVMEYGRGR
jgi:hypothetical protein